MSGPASEQERMPSGKRFKPKPLRFLLMLIIFGIIGSVKEAFKKRKK
jgi:hypothetical protein